MVEAGGRGSGQRLLTLATALLPHAFIRQCG
ncbi:hypothetical protein [Bacteriophage sp.]|nr:hypothetical protein [Bacteriophage sp.]UOF80111.1 hypothetical protein [Bacteriophage sp.]